jgi:hypothetical protein
VSSWLQGLIRNGIPEQPQYFCIYFYSGFMCFGNEGSLYIVVTYPPGIEAEGSAHHNIPESIHHCWIALSVIVACGKAEVTFADWRWQEHVAGHRFSEQLGGQEGVWRRGC